MTENEKQHMMAHLCPSRHLPTPQLMPQHPLPLPLVATPAAPCDANERRSDARRPSDVARSTSKYRMHHMSISSILKRINF